MAKLTKGVREKFIELVESYNATKGRISDLKKLEDEANKKIKEFMEKYDITSFDAETVSVTYYKQDKSTMDEEGLINLFETKKAFMKINEEAEILQYIPIINGKNLTDAIYNGLFTEKQILEMEKFKTEKYVPAIRLKKMEVES